MDNLIVPAAITLWVLALVFFRTYRIWLIYYALGTVGLALLLVYISQNLVPGQYAFEAATAESAHYVAGMVGIPTFVFEAVPNTILVLVIAQEVGWTALEVGVESSGLLEVAIFVGLVAFYLGWHWRRKLLFIAAGVAITFVANIARVLVIVLILHYWGKDWLLFAHTLVGKAVFFVLAIAIYWYLLTLPSILDLGRRFRTEQL